MREVGVSITAHFVHFLHIPHMSQDLQGKYWCFTWNNPNIDYVQARDLLKDQQDCVYGCFQLERVSTLHFQGYLEFSKLKRLSQLKRINPAIHWERRKGSQQQAIDYCTSETYKGEDKGRVAGPWTFGTPSESHQGRRNDILAAVETFKSGGIRGLAEENPAEFVRYHRGFFALASLTPPTKPVPEVILHFGPTGVGKTERVFDSEPDLWPSPVTDGLWFDGYVGQKSALFDDFAGKFNKLGLAQLLRVLDRYNVQLPTKGGFTWFVPERIYITSNFHPLDWYDLTGRQQQYPALERRFTRVRWWRSRGDMVELRRVDPDASADLLDESDPALWRHFWDGVGRAQLALDISSGRLVSRAPDDYYNF